MIKGFYEAKLNNAEKLLVGVQVVRESSHVDDLGDACVYFRKLGYKRQKWTLTTLTQERVKIYQLKNWQRNC